MKELSFEKMEEARGGSCGAAIGIAIFTVAAIGGASYFAPWIWANPATWKAAAGLAAANTLNIYTACT